MISIDVYPVGVLAAIQKAARYARHGHWRHAASSLTWQLRYLAEPTPWPSGLTGGCGRGWTRRAALRRLHRRMRKADIQWR